MAGNVVDDDDLLQLVLALAEEALLLVLADLIADALELGEVVVDLAVVPDGVDAEEELGAHVAQALEDAGGGKVRRGGGPDGAEGGAGEEGDEVLDVVGAVRGDGVVDADAARAHRRGRARDGRPELGVRQARLERQGVGRGGGVALGGLDEGDLVGGSLAVPQEVLGKVELGAGEPARGRVDGRDGRGCDAVVCIVGPALERLAGRGGLAGDDAGLLPYVVPEEGRVGDGPLPERVVVGQRRGEGRVGVVDAPAEGVDARRGDVRRCPEELAEEGLLGGCVCAGDAGELGGHGG